MPQAKRYRVNAPQVVAEIMGGEAIIVNLDTGAYFSLRDTAAAIWEGLERGDSAARITAALARRYAGEPQAIESAVHVLIDELLRESLIEPDDSGDADTRVEPGLPEAGERPAFTRPELEKYTDMADLLLLDPIHEVDDQGWPSANAQR